ncbi:hypothetical protein HDU76_001971 [Blyttiomyces sp. JEL0837]|nr:hypothetical protein HDU76_001971 [Blyttiomyces sp. JEL0837]
MVGTYIEHTSSTMSFTVPNYLLPNILDFLKEDVDTLKVMRSVSQTWRDFTDHIFFRKIIVLNYRNIDSFLELINPEPKPIDNGNVDESTNKQINRSNTPLVSLKSQHLQFVHYVEVALPYFHGATERINYHNKILAALKSLPNVKGIMYYDVSSKSPNSQLQTVDMVKRFFEDGRLSNLRVLNLNFWNSVFEDLNFRDFDFGWLKELSVVHTIAIDCFNVTRHTYSLMALLGSLPKSLRRLKLCIHRNYAIESTNSLTNHGNLYQMNNLQILEVIFVGAIKPGHFDKDNTSNVVANIQETFAWLMPNLEELKLNEVIVLRKNGVSGFLESAFTAFAWALVISSVERSPFSWTSSSAEYFMHHLFKFHHHVVYLSLYTGSKTNDNLQILISSLLKAYDEHKLVVPSLMPNLKSMMIVPFTSSDQRFLGESCYKIMEPKQSDVGGAGNAHAEILFPNLQVVTVLSYRKYTELFGSSEDEVKDSICQFVDTLPETVTEIKVSGRLLFKESDVTGYLGLCAQRRGIVMTVGRFGNPFAMYDYPSKLEFLDT